MIIAGALLALVGAYLLDERAALVVLGALLIGAGVLSASAL